MIATSKVRNVQVSLDFFEAVFVVGLFGGFIHEPKNFLGTLVRLPKKLNKTSKKKTKTLQQTLT